jgi:hypothetical protein
VPSLPLDERLAQLERLVRRDPARRGLIGTEERLGPLCPGHLARAARDLCVPGARTAIVTGFFIPAAEPPSAETDGPPGAVLLAAVLRGLGHEVLLVTDEPCRAALRAAAEFAAVELDLDRGTRLAIAPSLVASPEFESWVRDVLAGSGGAPLTHLVSIERVGPGHTRDSLAAQRRAGPPPFAEFDRLVPPDRRDRPHNMRGIDIGPHTAPLHLLFEEAQRRRPPLRTVGIGDGANEIGMGSIAWERLAERLEGEQAGRVPCRVPADHVVVAGTSNWGGFALAAACALLRGRTDLLASWTADKHLALLEHLVAHGPAVDGVTRRAEATVDGLPFLASIEPWQGMRQVLGLDP